ncbi:CRISPR-associated endoribonuclease Cas6 [Parapedobacter koreensis]|uniref:CRISPR-associated endoribonuclease n=1 Tax=Parapedobacter koreensis TaxID=332977 RepID=A0A1H7RD02_9SPHI|nr:CRISPR-associated endoribonuclease Cas6 [Parapedobacter koreensis]SEL57317.1 CRISPR-associated endoribonuclease Cas6 [Parapedobacter koreensis]
MRFNLSLQHVGGKKEIPFSYQYLLTGAIYSILAKADGEYATFLHDEGYPVGNKTFKLFTFSDFKVSFKPQGDCMLLTGMDAGLQISFHLPVAAENFIKGLFQDQELMLFDRRSRAVFRVIQVESLASPFAGKDPVVISEMVFSLLSPVVISKKDEVGKHYYLSPLDAEFIPILLGNWKSKYAAIYGTEGAEAAFGEASASVIFTGGAPKSRLVKIKANSAAETSVKGWYNFKLKLKGLNDALELVYNSGIGSYNSLGLGCLGPYSDK